MSPMMENFEFVAGPPQNIQDDKWSPTVLDGSNNYFSKAVMQYIQYFKNHGYTLENKIGFESTPTEEWFQTKIDVIVPPQINNGYELEKDLILTVVINKTYIICMCEMLIDDDSHYSEDQVDTFIARLNKLNEYYCSKGFRFVPVQRIREDGLMLRIELVWKNLLTEEMFDQYCSLLSQGFQEYGENFDVIAPLLEKVDLGDGRVIFPKFV